MHSEENKISDVKSSCLYYFKIRVNILSIMVSQGFPHNFRRTARKAVFFLDILTDGNKNVTIKGQVGSFDLHCV